MTKFKQSGLHGFVNLLVGGTTLAAYYICPHMDKMFPVLNSRSYRKKFCKSGIIVIKFSSLCHLDKSDDQKQFAGAMVENYWVHLFLAGLFSHCTSVAIYVDDGRAYFEKCPKVIMFSWGGT
jgi:hypothetical protein